MSGEHRHDLKTSTGIRGKANLEDKCIFWQAMHWWMACPYCQIRSKYGSVEDAVRSLHYHLVKHQTPDDGSTQLSIYEQMESD